MSKPQARAALALLATHNLVQNSSLNQRGYVSGNLAVTAGLLTLARSAGVSWEELGFRRGDSRRTRQVGISVVAAGTALVLLTSRIPALRRHLHDERFPHGSSSDHLYRALIRFPIGTALFEEVAFRGVLPSLLANQGRSADSSAAMAFALWHVIPTHHALTVNRIGASRRARVAGVLAGAVASGVAGYALSRIRQRAGGLFLPWLIHSAANTGSYLAVASVRGI